jgi:hypothetical protein
MESGELISCAAQVAEPYAVAHSDAQATSNILEGRKVQILPRSTKDRNEKQLLGDLVASMGGSICANVPKTARRVDANVSEGPQTIDIVIVGSADPKSYARDLATHVRERGTEYDVISAKWLEACRMRGWIAEPLPRDYRHVCDLTLERLANREDYDACDPPPFITSLSCMTCMWYAHLSSISEQIGPPGHVLTGHTVIHCNASSNKICCIHMLGVHAFFQRDALHEGPGGMLDVQLNCTACMHSHVHVNTYSHPCTFMICM